LIGRATLVRHRFEVGERTQLSVWESCTVLFCSSKQIHRLKHVSLFTKTRVRILTRIFITVYSFIFSYGLGLFEEPGWRSRYSDWLRAGRPRGQSSSPGRVKNFLFFTLSGLTLGSTQSSITFTFTLKMEVACISEISAILPTYSSVGVAMCYRLDSRDWFPGRGKRISSTLQRPYRFWGPPTFLPSR
jgi:hypothetical protein